MSTAPAAAKRLLILATTTGYQTRAFVEAAEKLGLSVVFGTDRCHVLEDPWRDGAIALRFEDPQESAARIVEYARTTPIDAVVALGDRPVPTGARACRALQLPYHSPDGADACRDKYRARERLRVCGLLVPPFARFPLSMDADAILSSGDGIRFPCVLKPLALSASRGVIRADHRRDFVGAFERIRALLSSPDVRVMREATSDFIQVEEYVAGDEIAVEGLVDHGRLMVLAIFDKPDPLSGPFFEETIYVTPSRLSGGIQAAVAGTLERAVKALGLEHGPLHAELRLDPHGAAPQAIWIMEVAARSIGGLCSRALRFRSSALDRPDKVSLEELLIRLALGEKVCDFRREEAASGVMMIPIPQAGIYEAVEGADDARQTPGVEDLVITAKPAERLVPLPEGASYLGFIFARGESQEFVDGALRAAHGKLRFVITPAL
ncbi:MAG TPA: ATP-grasp domain-containing protein, partial [Terriglobia bacterium]|nr:ATP-grasp domain-containing protein [Terriglobia bacterium]